MGKLIFFPKQKRLEEGALEQKLEQKRLIFVFSFLFVLITCVFASEKWNGYVSQRGIASIDERWAPVKDSFQNYRLETEHFLSEIAYVEGDFAHSPRVMKEDEMKDFAIASKDLWRFPYDKAEPATSRFPASEAIFELSSGSGEITSLLHFQLNGKSQVERIYQTLK